MLVKGKKRWRKRGRKIKIEGRREREERKQKVLVRL